MSSAHVRCNSFLLPSVSMLAESDTTDGTIPLDTKDIPRHRSPIQSVLIAGNERSTMAAESLRALGFDVRAIRKPTVAEGTERLRITLHSYNTDAEVGDLKYRSLQTCDIMVSWFRRVRPQYVVARYCYLISGVSTRRPRHDLFLLVDETASIHGCSAVLLVVPNKVYSVWLVRDEALVHGSMHPFVFVCIHGK